MHVGQRRKKGVLPLYLITRLVLIIHLIAIPSWQSRILPRLYRSAPMDCSCMCNSSPQLPPHSRPHRSKGGINLDLHASATTRPPFRNVFSVGRRTHVLAQPPEPLAVALTHDDRAHEDFDRSDISQRDLALRTSQLPGHLALEEGREMLTLPVVWYRPS